MCQFAAIKEAQRELTIVEELGLKAVGEGSSYVFNLKKVLL